MWGKNKQKGNTPLIEAAYKGFTTMCEFLVAHNATVDHQNKVNNVFVFCKLIVVVYFFISIFSVCVCVIKKCRRSTMQKRT